MNNNEAVSNLIAKSRFLLEINENPKVRCDRTKEEKYGRNVRCHRLRCAMNC